MRCECPEGKWVLAAATMEQVYECVTVCLIGLLCANVAAQG